MLFPQLNVLYSLFSNERNHNIDAIYAILIQPGVEEFINLEGLSTFCLSFKERKLLPSELVDIVKKRLSQILFLEFSKESARKVSKHTFEKKYFYDIFSTDIDQYPNPLKILQEPYPVIKLLAFLDTCSFNDDKGEFKVERKEQSLYKYKISYTKTKETDRFIKEIETLNNFYKSVGLIPYPVDVPQYKHMNEFRNKMTFEYDSSIICNMVFNEYKKINECIIDREKDKYTRIEKNGNVIVEPNLFTYMMKPTVSSVHISPKFQDYNISFHVNSLNPAFNKLLNLFSPNSRLSKEGDRRSFSTSFKDQLDQLNKRTKVTNEQITAAIENVFVHTNMIETELSNLVISGVLSIQQIRQNGIFYSYNGELVYYNFGGIIITGAERIKITKDKESNLKLLSSTKKMSAEEVKRCLISNFLKKRKQKRPSAKRAALQRTKRDLCPF